MSVVLVQQPDFKKACMPLSSSGQCYKNKQLCLAYKVSHTCAFDCQQKSTFANKPLVNNHILLLTLTNSQFVQR